MYNSLVQSVIGYGACIWVHREFSCITAVQHRVIHSFLGAHKKMPNAAALGEVGWIPQLVSQKVCITRQWISYSKMEANRLYHIVIEWVLVSKCDNVVRKCKHMFELHVRSGEAVL